MTTGSGLDGQLAFAQESVWGTAVTPTHAVEFDSETLSMTPTWLEPTGIRSGLKFKRLNRVVQSQRTVAGDFTVELATKGMGLLWKHALASSAVPVQDASTGAYKQVHVPGDFLGKGLTVQVGRPEPSTGTVQPFTYSGVKISQWQFSLSDGATPTLQLTVDGRDEDTDTALVTPTYPAGAAAFDFTQATLSLGGTVTTASGITTVSGGTAVATVITEIALSGQTGMATDRFGIGNAGLKSEQLENATPTITGTLTAEFNKSELYDVFAADGTTPMHLSLVGGVISTSTDHYMLDFIMPAVKLKTATPNVAGPDVVAMSTDIEAYDNETDPVIQVLVWSDEAAL